MTIETILPYAMSIGMTVITGLGGMAVRILSKLSNDVNQLNQKMAVIMSEVGFATGRADKIEERLESFDERLRHIEVTRAH